MRRATALLLLLGAAAPALGQVASTAPLALEGYDKAVELLRIRLDTKAFAQADLEGRALSLTAAPFFLAAPESQQKTLAEEAVRGWGKYLRLSGAPTPVLLEVRQSSGTALWIYASTEPAKLEGYEKALQRIRARLNPAVFPHAEFAEPGLCLTAAPLFVKAGEDQRKSLAEEASRQWAKDLLRSGEAQKPFLVKVLDRSGTLLWSTEEVPAASSSTFEAAVSSPTPGQPPAAPSDAYEKSLQLVRSRLNPAVFSRADLAGRGLALAPARQFSKARKDRREALAQDAAQKWADHLGLSTVFVEVREPSGAVLWSNGSGRLQKVEQPPPPVAAAPPPQGFEGALELFRAQMDTAAFTQADLAGRTLALTPAQPFLDARWIRQHSLAKAAARDWAKDLQLAGLRATQVLVEIYQPSGGHLYSYGG